MGQTVAHEMQGLDQIADGNWVAKIDVGSFMKAHSEDRRTPRYERPLIVPVKHWVQVLGARSDEITMSLTRERSTTPRDYGYVSNEETWTLVSAKPFVAVHFRDHDEWGGDYAKLHRRAIMAREMHRGELGRYPGIIRKPAVAESEIPNPSDNRQRVNWVRLDEVAHITGIDMASLIKGFAGFSPSTYYEPNVPLIETAAANLETIANTGIVRRWRFYSNNLVPSNFCGGEESWGGEPVSETQSFRAYLWIPQGFAQTIIRLVQFGYRPDNETPEHSFRIEAPMPSAPTTKLPVLSVEGLRELHELRQELPAELHWLQFQDAMSSFPNQGIGGDTNMFFPQPKLSDPLNGFAYYTNFRTVERFYGRVVLGICDWTRGGAEKSDNYWAGFLTVFKHSLLDKERYARDTRRDPAELRIWFWPGECLRQDPPGSKGGLCPDNIDPEIAAEVKNFLTRLGYAI